MKQIAAAFVNAQRQFAPALKTSKNPHFKSRYADLATCVEAVIDALNDNGIALIQQTHECDGGVMVETLFLHESGETLSGGKLNVPAPKSDPQGYGSALTYARRYSLMAAAGIAPEDDDGNAASAPRPAAQDDGFEAYERTTLPTLREAAMKGVAELQRAFAAVPATALKQRLWAAHQASLKAAAQQADAAQQEATA